MPSFQALDQFGNVLVSETDLIAKDFGTVRTVANQAGFLDDARFGQGIPYAFPMLVRVDNAFDQRMPTITFSGNRMSWTAAANTATILYGIN